MLPLGCTSDSTSNFHYPLSLLYRTYMHKNCIWQGSPHTLWRKSYVCIACTFITIMFCFSPTWNGSLGVRLPPRLYCPIYQCHWSYEWRLRLDEMEPHVPNSSEVLRFICNGGKGLCKVSQSWAVQDKHSQIKGQKNKRSWTFKTKGIAENWSFLNSAPHLPVSRDGQRGKGKWSWDQVLLLDPSPKLRAASGKLGLCWIGNTNINVYIQIVYKSRFGNMQL